MISHYGIHEKVKKLRFFTNIQTDSSLIHNFAKVMANYGVQLVLNEFNEVSFILKLKT